MPKADNLPPSCAVVIKCRNLNFLEPSIHLEPVMGLIYLLLNKVSFIHTKVSIVADIDKSVKNNERMKISWFSLVNFSYFVFLSRVDSINGTRHSLYYLITTPNTNYHSIRPRLNVNTDSVVK